MSCNYLYKQMTPFRLFSCICIILSSAAGILAADTPYIYSGQSWIQVDDLPQLDIMPNETMNSIFDQRVEPNNRDIVHKSWDLSTRYRGPNSIGQIVSIYNYMKYGDGINPGWLYIDDFYPEDYMFANQSLIEGENRGSSGLGDCDDFAILMASLINAVGDTTRIVLAYNDDSGHAYAEVYLGRDNTSVNRIVRWLFDETRQMIYVHKNISTNEVWLNLDWQEDPYGRSYPGGPFFRADRNFVVWTSKTGSVPISSGPVRQVEPITIANLENGSSVPLNYQLEGTSLAYERSGMKAYLLIWPIEAYGPWWVQETTTYPNGNWNSNAFFGRAGPEDIGKCFKVMAVIARERLTAGETFTMLPFSEETFKSKEIIVCRK